MKKIAKRLKALPKNMVSLFVSAVTPGRSIKKEFVRILAELPPHTHPKRTVESVFVEMEDGAKLHTRIYRPEGEGPWPTLVVRDPYLQFHEGICEVFVHYGFACIHQDVRGRFESTGEWDPAINERKDGIETINWLVEQRDIHDGNIALIGPSYGGMVQFAIAEQLPPEVKTMVADITTGDWYTLAYRRGHFKLANVAAWAAELEDLVGKLKGSVKKAFHKLITVKPAMESDIAVFDSPQQWYRDYLSNTNKNDAYWNSDFYQALRNSHRSIPVPVLMTSGWHDLFLEPQLQQFEELPQRNKSLFILRQGDHEYKTGELDINKTQLQLIGDVYRHQLTWLNYHLKGDNSETPPSGYLTHLNHDNRWNLSEHWPASDQKARLHLSNFSKSQQGEGKLADTPADEPHASYRYDPENPVPTCGGNDILEMSGITAGSVEQGNIHEREDILSFLGESFPAGATLTGSVQVTLTVASSAADSAFTAKLVEVFADGRARNIRDDISSLSYRDGTDQPQPYEADSKVDVIFNMTPIVWQLAPGSRLRLDISSSNYPAYSAHPNLAGNWAMMTESLVATQSVYKGVVVLPLTPLSSTVSQKITTL